jgi:hypothetical protein
MMRLLVAAMGKTEKCILVGPTPFQTISTKTR